MRTADLGDLWFFLDRGLGSVVVPGALRARGVAAHFDGRAVRPGTQPVRRRRASGSARPHAAARCCCARTAPSLGGQPWPVACISTTPGCSRSPTPVRSTPAWLIFSWPRSERSSGWRVASLGHTSSRSPGHASAACGSRTRRLTRATAMALGGPVLASIQASTSQRRLLAAARQRCPPHPPRSPSPVWDGMAPRGAGVLSVQRSTLITPQ